MQDLSVGIDPVPASAAHHPPPIRSAARLIASDTPDRYTRKGAAARWGRRAAAPSRAHSPARDASGSPAPAYVESELAYPQRRSVLVVAVAAAVPHPSPPVRGPEHRPA